LPNPISPLGLVVPVQHQPQPLLVWPLLLPVLSSAFLLGMLDMRNMHQ
jgi:hypothetical protein